MRPKLLLSLCASLLAGCVVTPLPVALEPTSVAAPAIIIRTPSPSPTPVPTAVPATPSPTPTPTPRATPTGPAAGTMAFNGLVQDRETEKTVKKATVTVRSGDPAWPYVKEVRTTQGTFTIADARAGAKVFVEIEAPGYAPKKTEIVLAEGRERYDFRLDPEEEAEDGPDPSKEARIDIGTISLVDRELREIWTDTDAVYPDKPRDGWWQFVTYDLTKKDPLGDDHLIVTRVHLVFEDDGTLTVSGEPEDRKPEYAANTWKDGKVKFLEFCGGGCMWMRYTVIDRTRMIERIGDLSVEQGLWLGD